MYSENGSFYNDLKLRSRLKYKLKYNDYVYISLKVS